MLAQQQNEGGKTRPKVGLVLGGGGAKGAAAIGILKELEREKIPVDYIAGTSIGAIIGGLYAQGYRADDLEKLFRSQNWLALLADRDTTLVGKVYKEEDGVIYLFGFPVRKKADADKNTGFWMFAWVTMSIISLTHSLAVLPYNVVPLRRLFPSRV